MPTPRKTIRPRPLTVHLPEDVAMRIELYLTSTALGRVPQGAWSKFFAERATEFFDRLNTSAQPMKEQA